MIPPKASLLAVWYDAPRHRSTKPASTFRECIVLTASTETILPVGGKCGGTFNMTRPWSLVNNQEANSELPVHRATMSYSYPLSSRPPLPPQPPPPNAHA